MTGSREEMIGRRLRHYRIVRQLGQGGMAEVFVAEDLSLKRRVALKVLPSKVAEDRSRLARFQREAESVARLNHPNIVTVYSVEEVDGVHFITMELVEGRSLESSVPAGGYTLKQFLSLARQLADALAAAHERGIIHRDLKPANVMVTPEGRVKILDFGLAKVEEDATMPSDPDAPTMTATRDGALLGTVPYMSPEQLQGRAVDERSDIFSLGLTFFEMLSGRPAFRGGSSIEQAAAILHDPSPSVTELRADLPRHLGRILASCLEKDPEARVQSAKDLRNQLAALETEVDTGPLPVVDLEAAKDAARRGAWLRLAPAAIVVTLALLVVAVIWLALRDGAGPEAPVRGAAAGIDSLAVLYFRNLTGDAELDWLKGGLTEMLVTDLSQVPRLRLVGTEKLHSLLGELGVLEEDTLGVDTVAELARRAQVENVLIGSFARVGEELRISARLQDAASGEILESSSVSDRGTERLFDMVDRLSSDLRRTLSLEAGGAGESDLPVEEVLTSSLEAYRLYSEGLRFHLESKDREAIPLFEAAVEADPGFSMALVRLATVSANLGYRDRARRYTQRALEGADRLPPRFRHYVEAQHYGSEWETYPKAIEAYRRAMEADPNRKSARNLLAMHLLSLERFDEAIEHYESLRAKNDPFAFTYHPLALAYAAQGRWEEGYEVLQDFVARYPRNWLGHWAVGWHLMLAGRVEEAGAALDRAEALHRDELYLPLARWELALVAENFDAADRAAGEFVAREDPVLRARGLQCQAINLLFRGRARAALTRLDEARAVAEPGADRAHAHTLSAETLLALGEPERALEHTAAARLEGDRRWPERKAIYLAALAEQARGRSEAADDLLLELQRRHAAEPNLVEERQIALLRARLAGMRGDSRGERTALEAAAAMLPPRGVAWHAYALPDHPAVWHDLGRAELEAGNAATAVEWLARLVNGESERIDAPIPYGRSLFLLGRAYSVLDRQAEARLYFGRFVELWGEGDLDRDRVAEARRYLAAGA